MSGLMGWQTDYQQLESGPFEAWFELHTNANLSFAHQYNNREMMAVGTPPAGCVALLLSQKRGAKGVFQGRALGKNQAAVLHPHSESYYRVPAGLTMMTVTIPASHFDQSITRAGESKANRANQETCIITLSKQMMDSFAACITRTIHLAQAGVQATNLDVCQKEIQEHMLTTLGYALTHPPPPERGAHGRASRLRSLTRVREYIAANLGSSLGMQTLARVANVSTRTLNTAFREVLDLGVVQYIRHCRLNAVKHHLLYSDSINGSVASAGRAFGFSHLSRFAGEYRALFDEYPSETLKQSRSEQLRGQFT